MKHEIPTSSKPLQEKNLPQHEMLTLQFSNQTFHLFQILSIHLLIAPCCVVPIAAVIRRWGNAPETFNTTQAKVNGRHRAHPHNEIHFTTKGK